MSSQDLPKPDFARNMKLIGYSDQGGREDGVQVMVNKGHAFVGHMFSKGFSVIDVRDPRNPKPVKYVPAPHNTWTIHLQTHGDLLLVINARDMFAAPEFQDERKYYIGSHSDQAGEAEAAPAEKRDWTAGLAVYDIANPAEPRQIGFMPVEGGGIHRIWYTGGRWAYVSAMLDGFTDYIFMTVDMADPTKPKEAGRYWLPGMNTAAGETPSWGANRRFGLHHAIVHGDTAYGAWRDGGLVMMDVSDRSQAEAHQASQLVAAVRRRHAQLPAAARSQPAGRGRRSRARRLRGRHQIHLDVRHPRADQPGQHLDLPDAGRGGLLQEGRAFRPAQYPREPAGHVRQLEPDLLRPIRTPAFGCSTSATPSSRRKWPPSCRRSRSGWSMAASTAPR